MEFLRNAQWVATDDGIEAISGDRGYWIEMERVMQVTERSHGTFYDWPIHLAEKEWVNIALFLEAFLHAIRNFAAREGVVIDEAMLAATRLEAFQQAWLTQQCEADRLRDVIDRKGRTGQLMTLRESQQSPEMKRYEESARAMEAIIFLIGRTSWLP